MSYTPEKEDMKEVTEHIETLPAQALSPATDALATAAAAERELSAIGAVKKYKAATAWCL